MMKPAAVLKIVPAFVVLAGLGTTMALAGPIEDRQALMKSNGKEIGALAKMFKGEDAYDAAAVKAHASKIADNLQKAATLFPENSKEGPPETWAKPEIWSDMAGFKAADENAYKAADAVVDSKDKASFKTAMTELGDACGACHKKFRRPKD